jgi:hypothetical protein
MHKKPLERNTQKKIAQAHPTCQHTTRSAEAALDSIQQRNEYKDTPSKTKPFKIEI